MRLLRVAFTGVLCFFVTSLVAQNQSVKPSDESTINPGGKKSAHDKGPKDTIEILSDTGGANLHPYMTRLLHDVRFNWYNVIPEVARAPIMKQGKVSLEFRVTKDGKFQDLKLVKSSGDVALDRAAYIGIAASQPLPLPADFNCQFVAIRFHFYYNSKLDDNDQESSNDTRLIPCVSTKIRVGEVEALAVSPRSTQVHVGKQQQFSVSTAGDDNPAVIWSLSGEGCSSESCGTISESGLYTAPTAPPNPPTISVTASIHDSPTESVTATITIVK
jgi:TonB family protein